jgi:hypothetical protein
LRVRVPFQDLLAPQHPQIIVDNPSIYEFSLNGVPDWVVCPGFFKIFKIIEIFFCVVLALGKGFPRPLR